MIPSTKFQACSLMNSVMGHFYDFRIGKKPQNFFLPTARIEAQSREPEKNVPPMVPLLRVVYNGAAKNPSGFLNSI